METTPRPLTNTIANPDEYKAATPFPLRLFRAVEREASPAVVVAAFAVVLAEGLPKVLSQDGWLALVSGREISRHGLPSADHLTVWSAGERWIDQQWLGHLGIYGLYALGGLRLLLLSHGALVAATFTLAVIGARRLGASPRATALVAAVAFLPIISTIAELRTQLPGSTLFVLTLWLLFRESRAPTRRVYFVFPLLVIWANVHGSVVLGAGLTILAGLVFAWGQLRTPQESRAVRWQARVLALVAGPIVCVFASPYGSSLIGYYHRTLLNGGFAKYVTEWRPTTFSAATFPVFLIALGGLWLLGRADGRVSLFERLAFLAVVPGAFLAVRNIGFLGLVALLVLPRLVDGVIPRRKPAGASPVQLGLVVASVVGVGMAAVAAAGVPGRTLAELYPQRATQAVARALERDSKAHVFADERFADWFLFRIPSARGRVAYDARFELLSKPQLERLYRWTTESTDSWRAAAAGNSIVVVYRPHDKRKTAALVRSGGRALYSDREVAVLVVPPTLGRAPSR
jgi:hypothetical protein